MKSLLFAGIFCIFTGFAVAQDCPEGYTRVEKDSEDIKTLDDVAKKDQSAEFEFESETEPKVTDGELEDNNLERKGDVGFDASMETEEEGRNIKKSDEPKVTDGKLEDSNFERKGGIGYDAVIDTEATDIEQPSAQDTSVNMKSEQSFEASTDTTIQGVHIEREVEIKTKTKATSGDDKSRLRKGVDKTGSALKSAGKGIKSGAKQTGEFLGDAGEVVVDGVTDAAEWTWHGVKDLFDSDEKEQGKDETVAEIIDDNDPEDDQMNQQKINYETEVEIEKE